MSDCRQGARTPINGKVRKDAKVEVGVEIGMILNIEALSVKGEFDKNDVETQVKEKVSDIFHINGRDKVLNNIHVYNIQ
jgi:hypothetical protein